MVLAAWRGFCVWRQVPTGEPGAWEEEVYLGARRLDAWATGWQVYPRGFGSIALEELLREQCEVLEHAQVGPQRLEKRLAGALRGTLPV